MEKGLLALVSGAVLSAAALSMEGCVPYRSMYYGTGCYSTPVFRSHYNPGPMIRPHNNFPRPMLRPMPMPRGGFRRR